MPIEITGWQMTAPATLARFSRPASPRPGWAVIEVAGCGVCHTDLGYLYGGVRPTQALPLVLGHEAAGLVVDGEGAAREWIGRRVLVPAVWPCGECPACRAHRPTACGRGLMPGNDVDGAFASHLEAPARWLCPVDGDARLPLGAPTGSAGLAMWEIAPVADAVTTPVQAIKRAGLVAGELAIVIGVGGVGAFAVQVARAVGAKVIAIDVNHGRLDLAASFGVTPVESHEDTKELRSRVREAAKKLDAPKEGWRIFEVSGTRGGQQAAWSLLNRGGSLSVVGYTRDAGTFDLSRLMALDATAYGNWGADPALYPEALALVASGAVQARPLLRKEPMSEAPRVLEAIHHGAIRERVVLVPN